MLTGDAPTTEWIALTSAVQALKAIEPLLATALATLEPTYDTDEVIMVIRKAHEIVLAAITEAEATDHNTTVKMPTKGEAAQKPTHQPAARARIRAW